MTNVKIICEIPTTSESNPISLMTFGFKCSPTMNRRNAIPKLVKTGMTGLSRLTLKMPVPIKIAIKTPERMYPMIMGCRNNLRTYETTNATNNIKAS